jgi:hypothetical protein
MPKGSAKESQGYTFRTEVQNANSNNKPVWRHNRVENRRKGELKKQRLKF